MQKRLLALVATVAMVLSMFAGIAFAADDDVTISTPLTVSDAGLIEGAITVVGATEDVSASIAATFTPAVTPTSTTFTVDGGDNTVYDVEIQLPADIAAGDYTLTIKKGTGETLAATFDFSIADVTAYEAKITEANAVRDNTGDVADKYTTESVDAFKAAYAGCITDLTKFTATQTAVNNATMGIQLAWNNLVLKSGLTLEGLTATRGTNNVVTVTGTTNATEATYAIKGIYANQPLTIAEGKFTFTLPADFAAGDYEFVLNATKPEMEPAAKTATLTVPAVTAPAPTGVHSIKLSKDKIISSYKTPDADYIAVRILSDDEAVTGDYTVQVLEEGGALVATAAAPDGYVNLVIKSNLAIQNLVVNAYKGTAVSGEPVATKAIKVRYNVSISPALDFSYSEVHTPIYLKGRVTDRYGNPVYDSASGKETVVAIVGPTKATLATVPNTNANGEFGFVVNDWLEAGDIALNVNGKLHLEGEVAAQAASIKVTPSSAVHSVTSIRFDVTGSGFDKDKAVKFVLKDADKNEIKTVIYQAASANNKGNLDTYFEWKPGAVGTYTLTASQPNYEATAKITVTNPATYNLIGEEALKTLKVGTSKFQFGLGPVPSDAEFVQLVKYVPATGTSSDFLYTVIVDGKTKIEKKASGLVEIESTKLENRKIQVIAYNNDADQKEVFNQTYTAKVTGWDVELDVNTLTVNETKSLSFVIKDEDGVPVNNATIEILGAEYKLSPTNYNAQAGTYVLKDVKIAKPGTYTIQIRLGDGVDKIKAELELDVVGKKVWNVSSDVATLLQGKAQDVKFTITQDSKSVAPARLRLVDKDGAATDANFSFVSDGVYKVNVKALKAGKLIARAENFDGTLCGEAELEVVAPKLVLIDEDASNVTENFKTAVKFKVIDPRDDSVIKNEITIVANKYVGDLEVLNASGNPVPVLDKEAIISGAEEYALSIFAKAADYKQAEKDEKTVAVQIKVLGVLVNGSFKVKPATITSDPEMIVIGANNNLTLTYKDANGKVLAGRTIKAGDVDLGKTDENGQVIYPVGVAAAPVKITGTTDVKDVVVEKTIKIGYDAEAPKVDYELDGNKATIVISDNVRLVRINIDGKEIDFWPGAKYEFVRTLQPGVNKFHIKAQDSNDNVFDEVVEIEYLTDAIVLEGDKVNRQGEFLFVQARQFEEFGAKFAWNQETKTARFVLDETTVEVTIGSTTAKVNGETVTMPVAPFLANDRTYVPVRFVSENLGWGVHWKAGDIVTITLP